MDEPRRLGIGDTVVAAGLWVRPYKAEITYGEQGQRWAHLCAVVVEMAARPKEAPHLLPGDPCTFKWLDGQEPTGWVCTLIKHTCHLPEYSNVKFYPIQVTGAESKPGPVVDANAPQIGACIDLVEPLLHAAHAEEQARHMDTQRALRQHLKEQIEGEDQGG